MIQPLDRSTLGELRRLTRHLPDDTLLLGEFQEPLQFNEVTELRVLPAVLEHTATVLLWGGQIVNYEYDLDMRLDAQLGD